MKIEWIGHSCFLITAKDGTKLVTDPYNEMVGKLPHLEADIVTVSHNHGDHNYIKGVSGNPLHISEAGDFSEKNCNIKGILTYHDNDEGKKRGNNIVFCFSIDGFKLCHCGDLGHLLSVEQLEAIGNVDVLFIPIGGKFTIDAEKADLVINQINPAIAIPMHYGTRNLSIVGFILDKLGRFLQVSERKTIELQELEINNKEELAQYKGIVILKSKA